MPNAGAGPKKLTAGGEDEMTFLEHLEALRWHLLRSATSILVFAVVAFLMKDFVFDQIIFGPRHPDFFSYKAICAFSQLIGIGEALCISPPEFMVQGVGFGELFVTHLKVSVFVGIVLAFPYIFWEVWRFIRPGLYEKEQQAARGFVFICSVLFSMGVFFGYFVISPFAVTFLAGYEIEGAVAAPTLASYVNYMVMFTIPVGLVFELPIVVYFLSRIGILTPDFMRAYRRHALVVILLAAAIITPPDVVTQFMVGVPLYILYEISIFVSARVVRDLQREEKEASVQ